MYGYDELLKDREYFVSRGAEAVTIGKSVEGRDIVCFKVGGGGKAVLSTAGIHARESASAYVVRAQTEYALESGAPYGQMFIPLVNPDGAELVKRAAKRSDKALMRYKANARKVDLNVNFDARWGRGRFNVFLPADENYVGKSPFSEPETRALGDFTSSENIGLTLSYHTTGRELYWYFFQSENYERDFSLARFVERALAFKYKRIDSDLCSAGGYKDWCIEKLGIPALTIELGDGIHPLGRDDLEEDIELNRRLAEMLSDKINS